MARPCAWHLTTFGRDLTLAPLGRVALTLRPLPPLFVHTVRHGHRPDSHFDDDDHVPGDHGVFELFSWQTCYSAVYNDFEMECSALWSGADSQLCCGMRSLYSWVSFLCCLSLFTEIVSASSIGFVVRVGRRGYCRESPVFWQFAVWLHALCCLCCLCCRRPRVNRFTRKP